jgi:phage-related baseplate assembly protein
MVTIWSGIGEMLGYYLDHRAREAFLSTCRKYDSMVDHANAANYRIHGVVPSTGQVTFEVSEAAPSPIIIPAGTKVQTPQLIEFLTLEEVTIGIGETTVDANVKQWTHVEKFVWGQSDGSQNQVIVLEENVADKSIAVTVAGTQIFTHVDTFAFSKPEDRHFVGGLNKDQAMIIRFGDDITGEIPQSAANIELEYYTSIGKSGNVPANSIVEIVDTITLPGSLTIECYNEDPTNGGSDIESLEDLRKNIPLSLRTKMRAVTEQDYRDIAILAPGVAKADVSFDITTGVTVYIVPVGGGIASSVLLTAVEDFFDDKRMITTQVRSKPVGEVRLQIEAIVTVLPGYNRADAVNRAKTNVLTLLSWESADINGRLVIGDLYESLESTDGIQNSQILNIGIIPYPAPSDPDTIALNWLIEVINAGSVVNQWKIQFVTSTSFNFFKNNAFINTFNVGDTITLPEIEFTILADSYVTNDIYIFNTYPKPDLNKGVIQLNEFSIIVADSSDVVITGQGGIS